MTTTAADGTSPAAPAPGGPGEMVTIYLDRSRTMIADLRAVRTEPKGRDPLGNPGAEFGTLVPVEMLRRWERVRAEFETVLAEQDQVLAAITAQEKPYEAAARARIATEAEAAAAERFGEPVWNVSHRMSKAGTVIATSVHRIGCTLPRREPWPVRLDRVCTDTMKYGPGSDVYRYERTTAAPKFCSRCTDPGQVADIEAGVMLGRRAGIDAATVAEWLAHGRADRFRAMAALHVLADGVPGEPITLPSGAPVR